MSTDARPMVDSVRLNHDFLSAKELEMLACQLWQRMDCDCGQSYDARCPCVRNAIALASERLHRRAAS
jgi:hypothetical protein